MRWDSDERGRGIGTARALVPGASELVAALQQEGWVAEQPEAHLLPHLRRVLEGSLLELESAQSEPDGTYALELRWRGDPSDLRDIRAAVYALLGSIAESASYIRQRRDGATDVDGPHDGDVIFEVATGMLPPDTHFATHGHTLRLRVSR